MVNFTITETKAIEKVQDQKQITENEKPTEQPKKDLTTSILEDLKSGLSKTAIANRYRDWETDRKSVV